MSCQHHQVDNATWQCKVCDERMLERELSAQTIVTAPNLAAGTGQYVADRARQKTVTVGYEVVYRCARCGRGGFVSADELIEDCGQVHRGDYLNELGKSRTGEVVDVTGG